MSDMVSYAMQARRGGCKDLAIKAICMCSCGGCKKSKDAQLLPTDSYMHVLIKHVLNRVLDIAPISSVQESMWILTVGTQLLYPA